MCAIIDVNVVSELWDGTGTEAGRAFRQAVDSGRLRLVVGGSRFEAELSRAGERLRVWLAQLRLSGGMSRVSGPSVDRRACELAARPPESNAACQSDDEHILALAQVSGARLLFTNDRALTRDFKEKRIVDTPRGKVYSTLQTGEVTRTHRDLLRRTDLCPRQGTDP